MDANRSQFPIGLLLTARSLRAFADGYVAVLLPAYLLALGFGTFEVGFLSTVTLFGSALATLAVGRWGHRFDLRRLLVAAAALMAVTGVGFATFSTLWPLIIVALAGTMNPGGGDVSVFYPLEHTALAAATPADLRTGAFARYSFIGSLFGAIGALGAGIPEWLVAGSFSMLDALKLMFVAYGAIGVVVGILYSRLPATQSDAEKPPVPLGPSRAVVWRLAGLFSIDSFAGGFVINALLALWLFERFEMSLTAAGTFFFWTGLLSAGSQLAAAPIARRIGLVNTMVFTHLPANLCLIAAAFASTLEIALGLLLVRSALSQMDVPARGAYVMSVVTPAERPAAASFTAVPRSLASALSPSLAGAMFAAGAMAAPLVVCGVLKSAYDLALLAMFRKVRPRD
jgi:MFS family permease